MKNNKYPQTKVGFKSQQIFDRFPYKSNNNKININSIIHSKNQQSSITTFYDQQVDHPKNQNILSMLTYENTKLKEENKMLKKQLLMWKGQSQMWTADSSSHEQPSPKLHHLQQKQSQKKEKESIHQLKTELENLNKQCKIHEETIYKMEQKITILTNTCKQLAAELKITQLQKQNLIQTSKLEKNQLTSKCTMKQTQNKQILQLLKNKVNKVMEMYCELQSISNKNQIEWAMWKQKWYVEKQCLQTKTTNLQKQLKSMKELKTNYTLTPKNQQKQGYELNKRNTYQCKRIQQINVTPNRRRVQSKDYSNIRYQF